MASIEKRSDTTYRITVSCGYDKQGKKLRKHKTITISDSLTERQKEKEIQKQAAFFEREVENGTFLDGEKITFEEFIDKWLVDYAEKQLAPKTLYENKKMLELRIIPALGHIKLGKIQPHHLLEFYNNLSENGIRLDCKYAVKVEHMSLLDSEAVLEALVPKRSIANLKRGNSVQHETAMKICAALNMQLVKLFSPINSDKGLSSKTISNYHGLISSILTAAVQWQLILTNPCDRVKPPKREKKEAGHYDDEQVTAMLELLESEPLKYKVMVYLEVYSGLRLGELVALEWSDIDFNKGIIKVSKAMQYLPRNGVIEKSPKTEKSKRIISVPQSVLYLLKIYRQYQGEERLKCGELWHDNNKIFTQWNGECVNPHSFSAWFRIFIKKHKLPHLTFHQLRHTNASLLIAEGVDIVTVSKRLGHSQTSTTVNIYSHALQKADKEASDKLENLLDKNVKPLKDYI